MLQSCRTSLHPGQDFGERARVLKPSVPTAVTRDDSWGPCQQLRVPLCLRRGQLGSRGAINVLRRSAAAGR